MDNTIPTFVSGTANGILIVLTFSEELDPNSLPPGSAFDISAGTTTTVDNSVSIDRHDGDTDGDAGDTSWTNTSWCEQQCL